MIDAGRLNKRVRIERKTPAGENDFGKAREAWSTYRLRWAEIIAGNAGESVVQEAQQAVRTYTITIRETAGIDETMRVVFRWKGTERTANVTAVVEDDDEITLTVEELQRAEE